MTSARYTQNVLRPGIIELAYGEPAPELLPVGLVRTAAAAVLEGNGPAALAYGRIEGPPSLRAAIARRIAAREGHAVPAAEVIVSGGNSQALDLVLTVFGEPGDVVLVESPTYNLALRTLRDRPLRIVAVTFDEGGINVDALAARLRALRAEGRRARLLYTIPTYHNPVGACLAPDRRPRLLQLAGEHDLLIVEDDVYRAAVPSNWRSSSRKAG